jgi:outer membrane receptor protein involved in Fe transport
MLSSNPEHALSLNAEQSLALTDTLRASLFLEYRFTDERMTDLNNDPEKLDGSYNLLNLRANLHFLTPDILLTVWGRNILEAEYTHTIADTVAQTGNYIASYNEPLMWGITVRKGF